MRRSIYSSDHEAFRDSVRAFLDRHVWPRTEQFIEARAFPRDLWIEAGRQGFLGLGIPERYDGSAAEDYRYNAVLGEELAGVSAALSSSFGIHYDVVAPYLVELAGETNGYSADLVVVAASTSPERRAKGITLFGVETGMDGFSRGRKLDKVGQPESDTAELFFDNVRVPHANVIGEIDRGFVHMMERLPQERIGAAVSNVAHAARILRETIEYVKERKAFGQPVGSFQHNKFLLAELVTQIEVSQAYVDQAVMAHVAGELSAVDAAKAKWWSAQVQNDVLDACVQLHGGYGYMNEYRVARAWRDARVTRIWAGSNEIMKELIGRDLGL
ncbi:acyl-CoA dehydrogenase family protein [Streptosporangium sp. NPDC005286]|uniref:acyl-CoA dehydrogenase family protein n=1 Tax=Streptosporangium sp. NPDC005286 TaxID=3154463 RepID=UPI0033B0C780